MKTGFIGLGNLGKAMAQRLISEGVELSVWNRSKIKAEGLKAEWENSPSALISKRDIVFINLTDSNAVQSVMSGNDGLFAGECNGKIIIDTTTNHFDSAVSFAQMAKNKGVSYLECPVMGSVGPALQGNLVLLVSGEKQVFETARPYLEKLSKKLFYLERPGLATKMKLINNLCLGAFMASIAEALALGEAVGVSKNDVLDILSNGGGNCAVLSAKREKLLNDDFSAQFSSAMIYKDLHYLQDLSKSLKRPLFTASIVKEIFGLTYPKKMENLDFSAIYMIMKEF